MSLPSPSPSPGPGAQNGSNSQSAVSRAARQSLNPSSARSVAMSPLSPRPGATGARPTSELLGSGSYQTPEVEALDQWFENLQNYEATLEEMAAASLDLNFKEELSAIEQWFRVLSEAERTAALYSLLQHSTQVQIRFFITVLQQMARSDPMTALLSPATGGSMQQQMESRLAQMGLKSPGLKAPPSPSPRSGTFLTPDGGASSPNPEAAATLVQQRARFKANNADAASRRISAPGTLSNTGDRVWQSPQLDQVAERTPSPVGDQPVPSPGPASATSATRPKSTDFSVLANNSLKRNALVADGPADDVLSPMAGGNWASMVNTPLVPMFQETKPNLSGATSKLETWKTGPTPNGRVALADPKTFRRSSKASSTAHHDQNAPVYGDDGNLVSGSQNGRGSNAGLRSGNAPTFNSNVWAGGPARSPSLSNRLPTQEEMAAVAMNPFGFPPALLNPLNIPNLSFMNMGLNGMPMNVGMDPLQAQYFAAQIAAGQLGQGGYMGQQQMLMNQRGQRGPGSSSARGKPGSTNGRDSGSKEKEDEVDPTLLNDVPAWLRSLRLHKYTPNFEGITWREMVVMDEKKLEEKGVAALGARRKMLKTFETVRAKMGIPEPGES